MVMRRGGNLDLPAFRQPAVTGNNTGNELAYQIEQEFPVSIVEALILAHHADEYFMFAAHAFTAPHQVIPDQQIRQILSRQIGKRRIATRFKHFEQIEQPFV